MENPAGMLWGNRPGWTLGRRDPWVVGSLLHCAYYVVYEELTGRRFVQIKCRERACPLHPRHWRVPQPTQTGSVQMMRRALLLNR